jgi:hypothetical protein
MHDTVFAIWIAHDVLLSKKVEEQTGCNKRNKREINGNCKESSEVPMFHGVLLKSR